MKKVVVSGYYGFNNLGDDAMMETLAKYFKNKNIEATFLAKNPVDTEKKYGVKTINRDNIFKIIKEIKKSDTLISGGGTLLQDITKVISIWYYLSIILIGIILKKKIYILFQGFGPINNKFNIWLTKKILKKVNYIILRDNKALEEMKKQRFNTEKVIVAADVVFDMELKEKEKSKEMIKKYIPNFDDNKKYIGVSIRPWKNNNNYGEFASLFDKISTKYNAEIIFFPFHKSQDYDFSLQVSKEMKNTNYVVSDDFLPSQLAGMMSLMSLNVGVRLHALVFSVVGKVPIAGITYDPKVEGFLKELNLEPVCKYEDLDADKVIKNIDNIINNNKMEYAFEKIEHNKKLVNEVLDNLVEGKYE